MPFYDDCQSDYVVGSYNHTEYAPPGQHIHPHYEIMVILDSSKSRISVNGKRFYTDRPYVAIFSPFCLHQLHYLGEKGTHRFLYYVDESFMEKYSEVFDSFKIYRQSAAAIFLLPDELVPRLLELNGEALENSDDPLFSKLLFTASMHVLAKNKDSCKLITAGNQMDHMVSVLRYMSEHFHEDITAESVAEHFFMSRAKLNRDFAEYTGVSFHQFLSELRVNKALFLLKYGYSVSEIAASVGFDNVSYFCKFFKNMKGVTPLQYAKKSFKRSTERPFDLKTGKVVQRSETEIQTK
ncbi:MAG: helix-turn-helix transcriptional regulator [Clostridia bacterium]|nr:helix-turn-helix transcriptional regulator [Clostridia bacterium]